MENIGKALETMKERVTGKIVWKKWERDEETKKMVLKPKFNTVDVIINDLQKDLESFSLHLFTASWQSRQYYSIAKIPPKGWVVMVYDFAENYSCRYQDEIQSATGASAATLHPIVCNYTCPRCNEATMTHSLIMISDDINHDYHAVHQFTNIAIRHIKSQSMWRE